MYDPWLAHASILRKNQIKFYNFFLLAVFFFPVYIIDMPRYDQISLYKIMFRKKKDNLVICDLIYIIRISH